MNLAAYAELFRMQASLYLFSDMFQEYFFRYVTSSDCIAKHRQHLNRL